MGPVQYEGRLSDPCGPDDQTYGRFAFGGPGQGVEFRRPSVETTRCARQQIGCGGPTDGVRHGRG